MVSARGEGAIFDNFERFKPLFAVTMAMIMATASPPSCRPITILEAEMSEEENENNTDIDPGDVSRAAGGALSSPARA